MTGKLFYGSQTGTTTEIASQIQAQLADLISEAKNIYGTKAQEIDSCDLLVLGGSTWGDGELTDDWQDALHLLDQVDFKNKVVALFQLGDQFGYTYNFVSAMKIIYDKVKERGGKIIADQVSTDGFDFEHSEAVVDGKFVGLVIDEVNQPDQTASRIENWAQAVRQGISTAV